MPRKSGIGRKPKKGKKAKLSAPAPVPSPPVDPGNPGVVAGAATAAAAATDSSSLTVPMELVKRSTTIDREQQEGFYADVLDEAIHDPIDNVCVIDIALAKRMTIAYIYIYISVLEEPLQFITDEDGNKTDQWQGKGGIYAQISKVLVDMHPIGGKQESGSCSLTKTIQTVLANISMCRKSGVQYEGKINWSGGAKKKTHE